MQLGSRRDVRKDVHQRNQSAMTPSDNPNAILVNEIVVLNHIIPACVVVLNFQSTVVNSLIETLSVARAATVFWRNDNVTLRHQLTDDVRVIRGEVGMHSAVRQNEKWILLAAIEFVRDENVRPELDGILRSHCRRVGDFRWRRTNDEHLVNVCNVTNFVVPENIVNRFF